MDNPTRKPIDQLFHLGDHRGTQSPGLNVLQVLFMREHNRQASRLKVSA